MAERKTIRKWWWEWNFDKLEQWLNEMSMQGWALCEVGWCKFTFERCEPGEYIIRLEMRENCDGYISFVEETGAEYIGRAVQWIYFRRKSELGRFELLSDLDSQIDHLGRLAKMTFGIGLCNLFISIMNSFNPSIVHNFAWINALCGALMMYATGRVKGRVDALEKERLLREN